MSTLTNRDPTFRTSPIARCRDARNLSRQIFTPASSLVESTSNELPHIQSPWSSILFLTQLYISTVLHFIGPPAAIYLLDVFNFIQVTGETLQYGFAAVISAQFNSVQPRIAGYERRVSSPFLQAIHCPVRELYSYFCRASFHTASSAPLHRHVSLASASVLLSCSSHLRCFTSACSSSTPSYTGASQLSSSISKLTTAFRADRSALRLSRSPFPLIIPVAFHSSRPFYCLYNPVVEGISPRHNRIVYRHFGLVFHGRWTLNFHLLYREFFICHCLIYPIQLYIECIYMYQVIQA